MFLWVCPWKIIVTDQFTKKLLPTVFYTMITKQIQNRTEQNRAESSRAEPSRAEPSRAEAWPGRAGQGRSGQNMA